MQTLTRIRSGEGAFALQLTTSNVLHSKLNEHLHCIDNIAVRTTPKPAHGTFLFRFCLSPYLLNQLSSHHPSHSPQHGTLQAHRATRPRHIWQGVQSAACANRKNRRPEKDHLVQRRRGCSCNNTS